MLPWLSTPAFSWHLYTLCNTPTKTCGSYDGWAGFFCMLLLLPIGLLTSPLIPPPAGG